MRKLFLFGSVSAGLLVTVVALRAGGAERAQANATNLDRDATPRDPAADAAAWSAAIDAIARSPVYAGLELPRQRDLVPLGADPASGLWEFWHVPSGARPERRPDGRTEVRAETGIALVLIPGGEFLMGAQASDPDGANYDPLAAQDEGPVRSVRLEPFFLGKFEVTQAQWSRLFAERPSLYDVERLGGETHPVEHVTWVQGSRALPRAGLTLPTEAQWEYAARAGTTTPWWSGAAGESIADVGENVLDATAKQSPATATWDVHEAWDDGHLIHAPVGGSRANPFGLHDMIGNVREWCLDPYVTYDQPLAAGTGLRDGPGVVERVIRGGCFRFGRGTGRSSLRLGIEPLHQGAPLGIRAARSVEPPF